MYVLAVAVERADHLRPYLLTLLAKEIQCTFRRERFEGSAIDLTLTITHSCNDCAEVNGGTIGQQHLLLFTAAYPKDTVPTGKRVDISLTCRDCRVNFRVCITTAVVVLVVDTVGIINLVEIHNKGIIRILTVDDCRTILEEPHRLHILRLLVLAAEIVGKAIVTHHRTRIGVQMQFVAPVRSPLLCHSLVARVAEHQHIKELVWHLSAHCIVNGQLVIVNHRFKVICPGRIFTAGDRALIDEFLHPRGDESVVGVHQVLDR